MEQNWEPTYLIWEPRILNGKTVYSQARRLNWTPKLYHSQKLTWNGLDLKVIAESMIPRRQHGNIKLFDTDLGNKFFACDPKSTRNTS